MSIVRVTALLLSILGGWLACVTSRQVYVGVLEIRSVHTFITTRETTEILHSWLGPNGMLAISFGIFALVVYKRNLNLIELFLNITALRVVQVAAMIVLATTGLNRWLPTFATLSEFNLTRSRTAFLIPVFPAITPFPSAIGVVLILLSNLGLLYCAYFMIHLRLRVPTTRALLIVTIGTILAEISYRTGTGILLAAVYLALLGRHREDREIGHDKRCDSGESTLSLVHKGNNYIE